MMGRRGRRREFLDALARECVRATFFLIGRNAEALPDLVRREIAEGHNTGSHSYSHPDSTLRLMNEAAARADIERGIAAVERAGYGVAGASPHTPFFRFPGFADTPALLAFLAGRRITVFGSDLWASDWRNMTPDAELALVMSRLEKRGRGIILFHDSKLATAEMLPAFLRQLKIRGYRVVHLAPGAGPTPVADAPPGWNVNDRADHCQDVGGRRHVRRGTTTAVGPLWGKCRLTSRLPPRLTPNRRRAHPPLPRARPSGRRLLSRRGNQPWQAA